MATKYDLPAQFIEEYKYYQTLFLKGTSRTTTGNPSYVSTSSGATYTVIDNTGEVGMQALLKTVLTDYMIFASDFNDKASQSEIGDLTLDTDNITNMSDLDGTNLTQALDNTLRSDEVKIGTSVIISGTGVINNIAIGKAAAIEGGSLANNIAIGTNSNIYNGGESIAIGYAASEGAGKTNVVIGKSAGAGMAYSATSDNNVCIGTGALCDYGSSVAVGHLAKTSRATAVAIGKSSLASATNGIAIGANTIASGSGSVAIGEGSQATSTIAVALGYADATNAQAIAIGFGASASGQTSTTIGDNASASGTNGLGIGSSASCSGGDAVAIGRGAWTGSSATKHMSLGDGATTLDNNSAAIGTSANSINANEIVLGTSARTVRIPGALTVTGSKSFEMPHPNPLKKGTHVIRHGCVESPTEGDTLYRYTIESTTNGETIEVQLPDYFQYLNKNVDVWVNGYEHFGRAFGKVINDKLFVTCELIGTYKVLVIGTRNDDSVQDWSIKGVERELGENWLGETSYLEVNEIIEITEIMEV